MGGRNPNRQSIHWRKSLIIDPAVLQSPKTKTRKQLVYFSGGGNQVAGEICILPRNQNNQLRREKQQRIRQPLPGERNFGPPGLGWSREGANQRSARTNSPFRWCCHTESRQVYSRRCSLLDAMKSRELATTKKIRRGTHILARRTDRQTFPAHTYLLAPGSSARRRTARGLRTSQWISWIRKC